MAIKVPPMVYHGLTMIRDSEKINMLDARGVQAIASEMRLFATVVWIEDNRGETYVRAITEGIEPEADPSDDEELRGDGS